MVSLTNPATAVVHRLALARPKSPSPWQRILTLIPKAPSTAKRPAKSAPRGVPQRARGLAFVVYRRHAALAVVGAPAVHLGIRPGSWIAVALRHGISDVDPAEVVLHVRAAASRPETALPVGARLLAHVTGVAGARVDLTVTSVVMPDGRRARFRAVAFDRRFHLGLPGFRENGRRADVVMAFGRSFLASADGALGLAGAQAPWETQALTGGGQGALATLARWRLRHRVYVPAQNAYVQSQ